MSKNKFQHPLGLGSFTNWLKVLRKNGGADKKYILKAALVSMSTFLGAPLNFLETAQFASRISNTPIDPPPIFILGHWRTGTTYLHHLICQDEKFCYVTHLQAMAPASFIHRLGLLKKIMAGKKSALDVKRPMDNVVITPESPQEEEFAVANLSPHSFLHGWYFPRRMRRHFMEYMVDRLDKNKIDAWKKTYLDILRKAAWAAAGKRLILKNPFLSTKIKILAELFPDAKFIHIYRNPYAVYASTRHLYAKVMPIYAFQEYSEEMIEEHILYAYKIIMQKLAEDILNLPSGNVIEIRYEDLEKRPAGELKKIYDRFGLPEFEAARGKFESYASSLAGYEKNKFKLTDADVKKVRQDWGFAIEKWGYELPSELVA